MSLSLSGTADELAINFLSLKSGQDIAALLEVKYNDLIYYIYRIPSSKRYISFSVKKKKGGVRKIASPSTSIKILQQKLNKVLQAVYKPKPSAHGFIANRNILSNAFKHVGKKYVFNIDLEEFFPSINFGRVRGMFMGKPYFLPEKVATILAHICCFNRQLPQGAPTSPVISNMICAQLDSQLQQLAFQNRCSYTRYADDITFSTTRKYFPVAIAIINDLGQVEPGEELNKIIIDNGFRINYDKLWLRKRNRRQEVTGLTVNKLPNVRRKYLNKVRAMLHSWEKYGEEKAEAEYLSKYNDKHRSPWKEKPSFKYVVKGKIEYLGMVRGKDSFIYSKFNNKLRKLDPKLASISEFPEIYY